MIRHYLLCFVILIMAGSAPIAWAQDPSPSPSASADAPVRPVLTSKFWKTLARDVAIPAATGVGGGVVGWHLTRALLKTGLGGALGSVVAPVLLKSAGAALVGVSAAVITNYFFNRCREAKVRASEGDFQLPSEQHPERFTDRLPRPEGVRHDPGFEDLPLDEEFPR